MHLFLQYLAAMRILTTDVLLLIFDFLIDLAPLLKLFIELSLVFGGDHVIPFDKGIT